MNNVGEKSETSSGGGLRRPMDGLKPCPLCGERVKFDADGFCPKCHAQPSTPPRMPLMGRIFLTLFGLQFILLVIVLLFNWDALTTVGHSKAINPLWSFIFAPTAALSVLLVKILI